MVKRMREKAANKAYNASVAFPRIWTHVEKWSSASDGRGPFEATYTNKIDFFLEHRAALLDKFPLSLDAQAQARACPALPTNVTLRQLREAVRILPDSPAHSFKYKDKWHSLTKEVRLAVSKLFMASTPAPGVLRAGARGGPGVRTSERRAVAS